MKELKLENEKASKKELIQLGVSIASKAINPIEAYMAAKRIETLAKAVSDALSHTVLDAIEDEPIEVDGGTIGYGTRTNWDFSVSQKWNDLKSELSTLEGLMKKAAEVPGAEFIDKETGEVIPPAIRKEATVYVKTSF